MFVHMWAHHVEQVLYVGTGLLVWWPVLSDEPLRWRLPYLLRMFALFAAMVPETIIGLALFQTATNPVPALDARGWGPSPLNDVQTGGAIMWVGGDGLMMMMTLAVMITYFVHQQTNATAGAWLEQVRRATMAGSIRMTGERADAIETTADLDNDEAAFQAYNAMLRRLHNRAHAEEDPGQ
jgi:putative copper resistance protein D